MVGKMSELQMANAFETLLKSKEGIKGFPSFNSTFREVSCQQGIADFIAITGKNIQELSNNFFESNTVSLNSYSLIISLLKSRSPRTEDFLVSSSGLTRNTVRKVLKELEENETIYKNQKGTIILSPNWGLPKLELWAFELKLKDWRRALFQTLQYKAFANRVVIVVPEDKENTINKNIDVFRNLQVGVMVFNMANLSYKIMQKPRRINPSSKRHSLFALGKIASELRNELDSFVD
ncbi:MAG: hypothetical protein A4E53_02690 [Pelotomaculum sp. PtaB.Bin104]|nr:MAG: hypothetical protein A4E53_02690 [Pelotomaculum sp. PtaB.Bin104]